MKTDRFSLNDRLSGLITNEEDCYVARCPELSVTSQGKNVESVRANLSEVIALYLETCGNADVYVFSSSQSR